MMSTEYRFMVSCVSAVPLEARLGLSQGGNSSHHHRSGILGTPIARNLTGWFVFPAPCPSDFFLSRLPLAACAALAEIAEPHECLTESGRHGNDNQLWVVESSPITRPSLAEANPSS